VNFVFTSDVRYTQLRHSSCGAEKGGDADLSDSGIAAVGSRKGVMLTS
jgi:hypothetical protein